MDSAVDDQIEADDQAGELDSYMMQKWVVDTDNDPVGSDCDHPGDSVEVINAIYNDGNETTEPESVPKGRPLAAWWHLWRNKLKLVFSCNGISASLRSRLGGWHPTLGITE